MTDNGYRVTGVRRAAAVALIAALSFWALFQLS